VDPKFSAAAAFGALNAYFGGGGATGASQAFTGTFDIT